MRFGLFRRLSPLEREFGREDYELATFVTSPITERSFPDFMAHLSDSRNKNDKIAWTQFPDYDYDDSLIDELQADNDRLDELIDEDDFDELRVSDYIFVGGAAIACIIALPFVAAGYAYRKIFR